VHPDGERALPHGAGGAARDAPLLALQARQDYGSGPQVCHGVWWQALSQAVNKFIKTCTVTTCHSASVSRLSIMNPLDGTFSSSCSQSREQEGGRVHPPRLSGAACRRLRLRVNLRLSDDFMQVHIDLLQAESGSSPPSRQSLRKQQRATL
jgi:hypothetical protein